MVITTIVWSASGMTQETGCCYNFGVYADSVMQNNLRWCWFYILLVLVLYFTNYLEYATAIKV